MHEQVIKRTKEVITSSKYLTLSCDEVTMIDNQLWISIHSIHVQDWCCIPILNYLEHVTEKGGVDNLTKVFMGAFKKHRGFSDVDVIAKLNAFIANLAQGECNRFIFLKGKVSKRDVLCLLDTWASHNFITQKNVERMELQLEEFKAPIMVHFADGVPYPTTLQAKDVPLQLGNWRGKVDFLVSTLGGMDCILGMEFITCNNVLIKRHNRLVIMSSNNRVVQVKAHKMPSVGGSIIHFMLGGTLEKECMGGYGMLCVMRMLEEFEPKEATNLVNSPKCIK
jgi:hypothetical protein